jgi:hypothetical protein
VLACVFAFVVAPACRNKPQISLEVDVPQAMAESVTWVEIGVFGTSCSTIAPMLPGGIPPEGATARIAFDRTKTPPPLGDFPRGRFAFAAVGRSASCAVTATGCTEVDVDSTNSVEISLAAVDGGAAACPLGARCVQARCVSGGDNGDPALGAGCSLDFVGAGPLANPMLPSGTTVSAPAIAATAKGFLIGYREHCDERSRVTFLTVDNGGGATAGPTFELPDRCAEDESDALTMALSTKNTGLAMMTRAACPLKSPGFDQLTIDDTGAVSKLSFQASPSRAFFSSAHALALDPATTQTLVAFTRDGKAAGAFFGLDGQAQSSFQFGGGGTQTGAWVAATEQVRAFVAVGTGADPLPADAGADDASPPADGGTGETTVRVQIQTVQDDPTALATQQPGDEFAGSWASLSALSGRVVVTSGVPGGAQFFYRVYEGAAQAITGTVDGTDTDGTDTNGTGTVVYADTALHQDRVFFAVERASPPTGSSIVLHAYDYDKATSALVYKRRVVLPNDSRIPSMAGVRDGLVAVAVSDTRVAVVWTTGKTLTDNDVVGGYALFACSAP